MRRQRKESGDAFMVNTNTGNTPKVRQLLLILIRVLQIQVDEQSNLAKRLNPLFSFRVSHVRMLFWRLDQESLRAKAAVTLHVSWRRCALRYGVWILLLATLHKRPVWILKKHGVWVKAFRCLWIRGLVMYLVIILLLGTSTQQQTKTGAGYSGHEIWYEIQQG